MPCEGKCLGSSSLQGVSLGLPVGLARGLRARMQTWADEEFYLKAHRAENVMAGNESFRVTSLS